jgi:3-oxoadipate enol-lactonase
MPFAAINGINLYYESHGEGQPVVFLHGRGGNHMSWWQQVPFFRSRYRCIVIDHREFGLSRDAPDGPGRAAHVDDFEQLIDCLKIDKVFLVGQSMGGNTALGAAVRFPERVMGLVLADTSGGVRADDILADYRRRIKSLPQDAAMRAISEAFRNRDPERASVFEEIGRLSAPVRESLEEYLLSEDGPSPDDLAGFDVPTLIIVGSDDVVVTPDVARMVNRCIKGSRLAVVDGAGHSVYFEKPAEFNELVAGFLASLPPR